MTRAQTEGLETTTQDGILRITLEDAGVLCLHLKEDGGQEAIIRVPLSTLRYMVEVMSE